MSNQAHSFLGNLVRDPESRTVNGSNGEVSVASFSVAVNGRVPEETAYFECEAWGKQADTIVKYFKKGKPILVLDAEAKTENWNDKSTGEKKSKLKFRVNRFGFPPGGKAGDDDVPAEEPEEAAPKPAPKPATPKPKPRPVASEDDDDSDIPF